MEFVLYVYCCSFDLLTMNAGLEQVCDQPHPLLVLTIVKHCIAGNIDDAYVGLKQLYDLGYSASDIITTLFRVVKNYDMVEYLKLEYIRVSFTFYPFQSPQFHKVMDLIISCCMECWSAVWIQNYTCICSCCTFSLSSSNPPNDDIFTPLDT